MVRHYVYAVRDGDGVEDGQGGGTERFNSAARVATGENARKDSGHDSACVGASNDAKSEQFGSACHESQYERLIAGITTAATNSSGKQPAEKTLELVQPDFAVDDTAAFSRAAIETLQIFPPRKAGAQRLVFQRFVAILPSQIATLKRQGVEWWERE